jgi:hypothetical protein
MANNLGSVAEKYTRHLDKILTHETKTADLNANPELVGEFAGVGKIMIAKLVMDGLGDYSRLGGFPTGDVDLEWEVCQPKYDRGREFSIDVMDDEERELVVSANVMGEFARTKVVPEVDAIRFARIAQAAKPGHTATGTLTAGTVEDAVLEAEAAISEVADLDGTVFYMTVATKNLIRKALPYRIGQGENPNGIFETFDDMKIVTVPQSRFYTAVDVLDGTTEGQTGGGYAKREAVYEKTADVACVEGKTYYTKSGDTYTAVAEPADANIGSYYELKTAAGVGINFLMVNPKACAAIQKHETLRYFPPEVNQDRDAHKWQYRLFHDLFVYENAADLIYLHKA